MTEFIKPFLELIKALVQPEHGTKFLTTFGGFGLIYLLADKGLLTDTITITVGCMVIFYYIADIYYKKIKKQENQNEVS